VVVVLIWAVALGVGLVVLAVLGYGLFGQVRRVLRAAREAQADLRSRIEAVGPDAPPGRHRA
jgi:hypothetical protein